MIAVYAGKVAADFVDYNNHMNDAAYAIAFSRSVDALMDRIGLDAAGRARTGHTIYTLALQIHYLHEVRRDAGLSVAVRILERDSRRLRLWLEMSAQEKLLATCEQVLLCVTQGETGPRAATFAPEVVAQLADIEALHAGCPLPEGAGEGVGLRRRKQAPIGP